MSKVLSLPIGFKEKRNYIGNKGKHLQKDGQPSDKQIVKKQKCYADIAQFNYVAMSEAGPLFDPILNGNKVEININTDHVFYQYLSKVDKETMKLVNCFLYALGTSELNRYKEPVEDSDDFCANMFISMRSDLSNNLRILVKDWLHMDAKEKD